MQLIYTHKKNYLLNEIYNATYIGLQFEFFCTKNENSIVSELSSILAKNVILTSSKKDIDFNNSILLKEYSGKRPRYSLFLAQQNYPTLHSIISETLKWIDTNAALTNNTGLKFSLSFDNKHLNTINTISNMNPYKLVFGLDENYIYELFPQSKKSPYSSSIKKLSLLNNFNTQDVNLFNIQNTFTIPYNTNCAIDLTEQTFGILNCNYIIGANYSQKFEDVKKIIEYIIIKTYNSINENNYTDFEESEFVKLTEGYKKLRRCFFEPLHFLESYKDIKLSVDLNLSPIKVQTYWDKIRTPLLKALFECNINKGRINWDTEVNRLQFKDVTLNNINTSGIDLISAEVNNCILEYVECWGCKINNSIIKDSYIIRNTKINESIIYTTRVDSENSIEKSTVYNKGEILNCNISESLIQYAGIGKKAKLDESTIVIDNEIKVDQLNDGLDKQKIEKDYKWLKELEDKRKKSSFANEYKHNY